MDAEIAVKSVGKILLLGSMFRVAASASGSETNPLPNEATETSRNEAPSRPWVSGPFLGVPGNSYEFTARFAIDPDLPFMVSYRFSWGDGDTSEWSAEWVPSFAGTVTMSHSFEWRILPYAVKAQARDMLGATSLWSPAHLFKVTRLPGAHPVLEPGEVSPGIGISPSGAGGLEPGLVISPVVFNPVAEIEFYLPQASEVTLKVYNALGREVACLAGGWRTEGLHRVVFEGSGYSSGVYFCCLETPNFRQTRKMVLKK